MKTNKIMRAAALLLILVNFTTAVISGSYAKYTSSASTDDTARISKWGVTVSTSGKIFSNQYVSTDGNSITVKSGGSSVAPGTSGEMTISVSGTPETSMKVKLSIDHTQLNRIFLGIGSYCIMEPVTPKTKAEYESMLEDGRLWRQGTVEEQVTVEGKVTVNTKFTYSEAKSSDWSDDAGITFYREILKVDSKSYYYPVKFTLRYGNTEETYQDTHVMMYKLKNKVIYSYDAESDTVTSKDREITISWKWDYEDVNGNNNDLDTMLMMMDSMYNNNYKGYVAAYRKLSSADNTWEGLEIGQYSYSVGTDGTAKDGCLKMDFNITATATQID